jgi:hypothetical protein
MVTRSAVGIAVDKKKHAVAIPVKAANATSENGIKSPRRMVKAQVKIIQRTGDSREWLMEYQNEEKGSASSRHKEKKAREVTTTPVAEVAVNAIKRMVRKAVETLGPTVSSQI